MKYLTTVTSAIRFLEIGVEWNVLYQQKLMINEATFFIRMIDST